MESISAAVLLKAIDGLSAREAATAENIANANTPSYRPIRVSFEEALAAAAKKDVAAVQAVKAKFTEEPASAGELRLDLELGSISATAMRYSALIEVLNRELQLDDTATRGNAA